MQKLTCLLLLLFSATPALAHPFDDLSATEVAAAVKVLHDSGRFSDEVRFPVVKRQEPKKREWLAGTIQSQNQRQAFLVVFDFKTSMLSEVVVDLNRKQILSTKELPGLKPPLLLEEYDRARVIARADARWQNAMKRRGFTNLEEVFLDMWAPGLIGRDEVKPGQRLLRGVSYKKEGKNVYGRPIDGVIVTVDLSTKKVVSVWDQDSPPVAAGSKNLGLEGRQPDPPLKRLESKMPEGASFKIEGQEISWSHWKFRYSMDPMQGLQLFHVRFADSEKERSIIYKIALADMLVPYGDGDKTWSFRSAFDVGEYGLGKTLHPLTGGQDVPSYATLLDTVIADDLGHEALVIKGLAVYERDGGILWKHRNSENGDVDMRRNRQLVIGYLTTIGNYDYGVNYIFSLDGSIRVDVQLTGMLLAKGTAVERNVCADGCLPLVEKNVLAPPHQHFFNFRIDFDIDGADGNRAAETNVHAIPRGPKNPDGNAFELVNTVLLSEKKAVRDLDFKSARKWKVFNTNSRNALNHPRGYALFPEESAFPYLAPANQMRQRARFIEHQAWFTVYKDDEMNAAHQYPTTAPAGGGLPQYVANDESLAGADVVMWYTFGVTHVPHPEEWPIMNTHHTGFVLVPMNFFSENPGMSVPE
ncbi:MAG: primary-amine oxidase [Deltaproteobacteria bacterium]|nr:primary-amine oxidase [Deltaproteobacteria bacterium]